MKGIELELNKIIKEYVGNSQYPAISDPPRKDFSPSPQKGYNVPYQATDVSDVDDDVFLNSQQLLWPMQSVSEDLADSYTYLFAAIVKMEDCLKLNAAASSDQKSYLKKLISICKILNKNILSTGKQMDKKFNLSTMADRSIKI